MSRFTKFISIMLAVVLMVMSIPFTTFALQKGDVNGDGKVSAIDVALILRYIAGIKNETDLPNAAGADVDGNGIISAVDARLTLQIALGFEVNLSEEQFLAYFVKSFNGVKANAATATYKYNKVYNYNNYVYIRPVLEEMYNMTLEPGAPSMKEELTAEFSDDLIVVNKTYTGEEIATAFPPATNICNLTMNDISNISFQESGEYYLVEVTVKGKRNPKRNESIGNVATINTKEDFESEMSPEDLEKMSIDCDYKEAVAKAKIEKSTGNMVEYSVDYPMIMIMNVTGLGEAVKIGMGLYEEWSITY